MRIVFFKRPLPKKFEYNPIYYNERKEELEKRRKKLDMTDDEERKMFMKDEISHRWGLHRKSHRKLATTANIVFYIVVLGILVMFVYYLMKRIGMSFF